MTQASESGDRHRTAPVPFDGILPVGRVIHLVRWTQNADGWLSEKVAGALISREHDTWTLSIGGEERVFPRPEWQYYD
jgi:hypothetical protein